MSENGHFHHRLTKYERARILGYRVEQLAKNAISPLDGTSEACGVVSLLDLAKIELDRKVIDSKLGRRTTNTEKVEIVDISSLQELQMSAKYCEAAKRQLGDGNTRRDLFVRQ